MRRPAGSVGGMDRDSVLRAFLSEDGSLRTIPAKASKRLVVLDHVAQAFPIGES